MNDADLLKQAVEAAQQAPPAPPARQIPFGPVPMSWNISQAQASEGVVIAVHIQTPEGDKVFFLAPSIGKQIGEALVHQSTLAETGLIVPQ